MDGIRKTLYIPLYGKAYVSRRGLFLRDEMAEAIWGAEGFLLKGKAKSKWLAYTMGMRAAVFDRWTEQKLDGDPEAVVLHLGCGLDARVCRVKSRGRGWFDLDFPEVIAERRRYFPEMEESRMIASNVCRTQWLEEIPEAEAAVVVMEGLSMYLKPEQLRSVLRSLSSRFERVYLLMDIYTVFGARVSRYKNPINTVGVTEVYGMDSPEPVTEDTGFRFCREGDLTPETMISQLPKGEQRIFRTLFAGKTAKKIYRLYELEA